MQLIMLTIKNKTSDFKELTNKVQHCAFLKAFSFIMFIAATFFCNPSIAQQEKDTTVSVYSTGADAYHQMLDYSRPGKYHQLLADLVGTWTFKGRHYDWVDSVTSKVSLKFGGSIVRRSFAHGRYFVVNVKSEGTGTLEMPIQDGKMVVTKFQGLEIEGYDNVKKKFVKTLIGNHLNSGLTVSEGVYDSTKKAITFDSDFEAIPGMKLHDRVLYVFIDKNHYKWEVYQQENGKYRKGTEIDFTRNIKAK
jgi:hypothetical protein